MGTMGDLGGFTTTGERVNPAHILFDRFVQASTCKGTLKAFQELCDHLELKPCEYRVFYHKLKSRLNYWKAKALWAKLDKRAGQKEYKKGRACTNSKCLIIGAGPCGLRTAIELGFLGAKVVLLEKRDAFSRNNVLHLWPFTIQDLRGLGAKKFYGKFCAGAIDHISIRQLQLMLLKVALLLGIEIHVNAEFKGLIEPPEDQENERIGWRAEVLPRTHPVNELEFDVIIGADGRRNTLAGFRRKEFRGKLAIAITANFINRNTTAEAKVEEISGVAFIFNQKFFQDLREATGIDLENIVYYKDDTHYFVMTAKKQSLLEKGVILHDYADTEMLLSRANVDQAALLSYACEAADFSTNHQLPTLDFAINHYGQPDVAMFDFTCMYASENAALVRQRNGRQLLVSLVGDSLLEPFWPMGTGIARGFLAAMDSGWMVKSWAQGNTSLDVLAERESIYRLLPQTTPENINKNFSHYSVDPTTRYPNISLHFLRPNQVRHLIDTGDSSREMLIEMENVVNSSTPKLTRNESIARSSKLLNWCQRQTEGYRKVSVTDLTMSWKSGMALCALIHRYRPDLIDFDSLDERDQQKNNQLGFDVAEREFGISPCMTGKEMSQVSEPDKLSMVMYLSQFYEMFKDTVPPGAGGDQNMSPEEKAALINSTKSPISFLSKLGQSIAISRKRNPKDKKEKEVDGLGKRRKTSQADHSEDEEVLRGNRDDRPSNSTALTERKMKEESAAVGNHNKVKSMATQLLAKFEENAPAESKGLKRQGDSLPSLGVVLALPPPPASLGPPREPVRLAPVPAWRQKRTQQQEQLSFRYKEKVKCQTLPIRGEQPRSGTEWCSGSRSCPKRTILLSSTSSLSLHSQHCDREGLEEEGTTQDQTPQAHRKWEPVQLEKPEPIHIPSIQERSAWLVAKFKGKPEKPKLKKKPSRFFIEQRHLSARTLSQNTQSLLSPPEALGQEIEPLRSDGQMSLRVLSVQERAEQLASQFQGKLANPQRYLKMYTGEVSLLAEQIANQLQPQEEPKPLLDKRELGSLRKEFPQNIGGSDVCFFCRKRVYVMERLSAEGKFFHRSCFKCDYCGTTLRLSSYAFDVEDGKFYCKPHYCYRSSGQAQRKRPAPIPALLNAKDNQGSLPAAVTVDSPGRGAMASPSPTERRSSVPEVNGLQEPSLAKRLRGTPERIELENYRLSLQREEDLEEVPEETLAEHNLSSVLDKDAHADLGSSSSESDMEEEDQEEEEQHEEEQQEPPSPSDLGGVPWKEAVELHAKLKTDSDPGAEGEDGEGEDETHGHIARDLEVEEEDDEEEEEDDDAESTDEGEYCPWEQELQSGIWLENLQDEEDTCRFKARNLQIQQVLQPVDPTGIKNLRRVSVLSEGDKEEPPASASQPSTTLTQSPFTEPCEDDDPEAEVGSRDFEPGTEMDQEDIPSDAEAEARLHQSELSDALPEEDKKSQSQGIAYSIEQTSVSPVKLDGEVGLLPVKPPTPQPDLQMSHTSPPYLVKSPGMHFFPDPFASENVTIPQRTVHTPNAKSPQYATPAPSPIHSPVQSPIRSQPIPLPETVTPKSPVTSPPCSCPPTGNPLSPICAQPLPCHEPSSPLSSDSPVRTQPVPAITSTPLAKPASSDRTTPEPQKSLDLTDETPVKKTDIIEEFWLKSAEIRKSLGLTPLDRSSSSKAPEKCHVTVGKVLTPDSPSTKSYTPEDLSEELRPSPSPFTGRSVIRRLNITVEGQVISPAEPKSNGSERRDLSSSSGLGLNDSTATNQNSQAASDSYHTSDSTMLTPPSSPPPPPPNEEPATLRQQQKHQVSWDNGIDGPTTPEPAKAAPTKTNSPVPAPRTQLSPVSMPVSAPKPAPRTTPVTSPVTSPVTAPVTPLVVMRREKSSKPRREEVRKSFVECVAEIPFADDVEDTFDERTPDTTMDRFYTPPSSKPNREREKRPLHLALAMENGKPIFPVNQQVSKSQKAQQFSPEAKEIAEERMRAREKSIKSQALKEAMAKQLNKMRETDTAKGAAAAAKVVWNVASSETSGKSTKKSSGSPKTSAVKSLESKKGETLPERFFSSQGNKSLDSSTVSSDGSASGGKSKKRSSLFSPRKNKKEKKAKNESQLSAKHGTDETPSPPKHKSLWKAVFSGYKKDKKKNKDDKSCPSTPSSSNTNDSGKKRLSPLGRSSDLKSRRNLSFSEDSDLSCDDVLERSSQKSRTDSVYVPHALAFKRAYATKKTYTEEELNAKLTRRVQKAARRQAKQEELKRLHRAQTIQRQLEQVEEKQRQLEERGVAVEKALRGEAVVEPFVGTPRRRPISFCPCCSPEAKAGSSTQEHSHSIFVCTVFFLFVLQETQPLQLRMGKKDDPKLMQEWFKLVQEKNALVRYESELMIFARELELEDRQSRLQQDLRERMAIEDHLKTEVELAQEKHILNEMLEVVEQRDSLVALLEEQRLREKEEDKDLESVMLSKGFNLNWS
ncbi:protein-methionine sulfoxide oxidase mical3a-like isoform X6 [Salvelinus fontinalis]|uniref:protein-methionine sulfoxide oxidase mical3a-like isoform X6 n=1 Tax=Salvelinus fontinalis TaxID=8038 RepID=UPI002486B93D|nr:protein-methionine sulfoxide oxidase mical3a-like isoform X6 [Salvelinus fontinalis]